MGDMRTQMTHAGLDPQTNDGAHVPAYLALVGVEVAVITARQNASKSIGASSDYGHLRALERVAARRGAPLQGTLAGGGGLS